MSKTQKKPSPLSNLKSLTPEQEDQLFELLRGTAYHAAVAWVAENWGLPVSVASLQRWWARETARRTSCAECVRKDKIIFSLSRTVDFQREQLSNTKGRGNHGEPN